MLAEVRSVMYCCGSIKWYSSSGIKCLTERLVGIAVNKHEDSCDEVLCVCVRASVLAVWLCDALSVLPQGTGCVVVFPAPFLLPSLLFSLLSSFSHFRDRVFLWIMSWPKIHQYFLQSTGIAAMHGPACLCFFLCAFFFFSITYELYNYPIIKLNLKTGLSLKWLYHLVNGSLWKSFLWLITFGNKRAIKAGQLSLRLGSSAAASASSAVGSVIFCGGLPTRRL